MIKILKTFFLVCTILISSCAAPLQSDNSWITVTNFEESNSISSWTLRDTRNDTDPYIESPQVTKVIQSKDNHYLLKKPAAEGVVGNRKALSYIQLPQPILVGETATMYTRINVEYFPNNHVFGLSDMLPDEIDKHDYNAFEPSIRVTDKKESNGFKNDGTLMVRKNKGYEKIKNPSTGNSAAPLKPDTWYELWYVVNNSKRDAGGQRYDVYVRGGEFEEQTLVFSEADFRMQREQPLIYFLTNCNTGPKDKPYGNGGLKYDDIYMAKGVRLTTP